MKRIISIILIILFLHLRLSPYELSYGKFFNKKQITASSIIRNNYLQEKLSEINHPVIAGGVVAAGGAIAGFTLAEMTLAITVIGCLFALTVPDLIQKIQYDSYKIKFKETYSQLNQAMMKYNAENLGKGILENNENATCRYAPGVHNGFLEAFCNNLKCIKICYWDDYSCFDPVLKSNNNLRGLDGNIVRDLLSNYYGGVGFILPNGASVGLTGHAHDAGDQCFAGSNSILIDVNGLKNGPHRVGVDVFSVVVDIIGYPRLRPDDKKPGCDIDGNTNAKEGWGCSEKVLKGIDYAVK